MIVKTFYVLEYYELFSLIEKELNVKPELDGVHNDSCFTSENIEKSEEYSFDSIIQKWKNHNIMTSTHIFIQDYFCRQIIEYLVNKDILPEGNYLIEICW